MVAMRKVITPEVTYNWTILASPVAKKDRALANFSVDEQEEEA
jgi:hypothetical protein